MQRRHRVIVAPVADDAGVSAAACARLLRDGGIEAVLVPCSSARALAATTAQEDADAVVLVSVRRAATDDLAGLLRDALITVGSDAVLAVHADAEPIDPTSLSELLDARLLEPSTP